MLVITYTAKRKRIKVAKWGTLQKYLNKQNCDCDLSPFKQVEKNFTSFIFVEVACQETFIVPFSVPPVSQNEKKIFKFYHIIIHFIDLT
jgi:hypothetical protein